MMTPRTDRNQGDVKSRAGSTLPLSEPKTKGNVTARSGTSDRRISAAASTGDLTSIRDESEIADGVPKNPEVIDLPFFKQDPYTDVVLQVGGRKLFTCRSLLAYNSPVMAKVLSSGSKNKDLDLPEKDYDDVVELLAYIDPRVDYIITEQSAIALLPLAEEYEIESLKLLCEQTIMKSFKSMRKNKRHGAIPVEICLEYLQIADKYRFDQLRDLITEEFVNNDDGHAVKALMESSLISQTVKLTVLDKKVEKVHFELDKERRERTAIETKLGDYGHKRFRRPIQDH